MIPAMKITVTLPILGPIPAITASIITPMISMNTVERDPPDDDPDPADPPVLADAPGGTGVIPDAGMGVVIWRESSTIRSC